MKNNLPFPYDDKDKMSILSCAKKLIGKRLSDYLPPNEIKEINSLKKNKGGMGTIIEKYIFGKNPNSSPLADFENCGVDCKVTPLKMIKNNELRPKERLVSNIINFETIIHEDWSSSSFLKKNSYNLVIRYLDPMNASIRKVDYWILDAFILDLQNSVYIEQFKDDWEKILNTIKTGYAHELSESDTVYLGACTKGANNKSLRIQPKSSVLAKQRAFCFKQQFMKRLLDDYPLQKS